MTVDEIIDLAVALFAEAEGNGDTQLANDAAGIALDLVAEVRYAMRLFEQVAPPPLEQADA
jgi:hypothetical protein